MFARHKALLLSCLLGLAWLATGPRTAAAPRTAADDDPLPKDALSRVGTVRFRTGDGILCLAYSPDGKTIASGGRNDRFVGAVAHADKERAILDAVRFWTPGPGRPLDPGRTSPGRLERKQCVVSVEPRPSRISIPVFSRHRSNRLGGSASPALGPAGP